MKTFFSVLAFMLVMFFSMYKSIKKQQDESRPAPRRRRMAVAGEESADDSAQQSVDGLGEPYFSYEYEEPAQAKAQKQAPRQARPQSAPANTQPMPAVAAVEAPLWFDLRQAVIYQTVLNNPYVSEINQNNQ